MCSTWLESSWCEDWFYVDKKMFLWFLKGSEFWWQFDSLRVKWRLYLSVRLSIYLPWASVPPVPDAQVAVTRPSCRCQASCEPLPRHASQIVVISSGRPGTWVPSCWFHLVISQVLRTLHSHQLRFLKSPLKIGKLCKIFQILPSWILGQWEEDGLLYTFTQRRDLPGYECFVGQVMSSVTFVSSSSSAGDQQSPCVTGRGAARTARGASGWPCLGWTSLREVRSSWLIPPW